MTKSEVGENLASLSTVVGAAGVAMVILGMHLAFSMESARPEIAADYRAWMEDAPKCDAVLKHLYSEENV